MAIDLVRLRAVFLEEFEERRTVLQSGLLELERDPEAAERLLPELFREAHSLKGGAQAVRLPAIASVCHRLEDTLSELRNGTLSATTTVVSALLGDVDVLTSLVAESMPGSDDLPATTPSTSSPTGSPVVTTPASPPTPERPALRVPAGRLDVVLQQAGDMLQAHDRLAGLVRGHDELAERCSALERRWQEMRPHVDALPPRTAAAIAAIDRAWKDADSQVHMLRADTVTVARLLHEAAVGLEHSTRALRLQPFKVACSGFDRVVRDLTNEPHLQDRHVTLRIEGEHVELDGEVVSALREPLLHLVRNAVAHGIEDAAARRRAGKPELGTVTISADVLGDQAQVSVTDDGAGLDVASLRAEATARGLDTVEDDAAASRLAWIPGLSTAETPDELAGRGVGLDAVLRRMEELGGTAELHSRPGHGCTVVLRAPVSMSTLHALMVAVDDQTVALPSAAVLRVVRLTPASIRTTAAGPHAPVEGELFRVVSLRAFLGVPPARPGDHLVAVLVNGPSGPAALVVDRIVDARQITRRKLHPRLTGAPGVVGTTVLPTGATALVLNPLACLRQTIFDDYPQANAELEPHGETARVLLAEDSATTRALEQGILEGAGYDVIVAADGEQAWQLLRERGADLVVTDVEMPGMDGFSLCRAIRSHPRLGELPVVLVTSRASDDDRHRGVEVGANAYLVKGAFDQAAFLATIERLL